jgi:AraC-like DNA-binding protein
MIDHRDVHPPLSSAIGSEDPDLIRKYLDESYDTRFSIERASAPEDICSFSHTRVEVGRYATEEITLDGEVLLTSDHVPMVVVLAPWSGRVDCRLGDSTASAGPGDIVLGATGGDNVHVRLRSAHLRAVVLDPMLLTETAGWAPNELHAAPLIRFSSPQPISAGKTEMFRETERYVSELIRTSDASDSHLMLDAAGRLLASAVLSVFPNDASTAVDGGDEDAVDDHPVTLRQAIDFIHTNAMRDININDIATAVYLTPRTVQYMFRRHLNMTPTAYLRGIRLDRARDELCASDRGQTTVAATASRWGFAHTGRFAVMYRQMFGESPHETLRK